MKRAHDVLVISFENAKMLHVYGEDVQGLEVYVGGEWCPILEWSVAGNELRVLLGRKKDGGAEKSMPPETLAGNGIDGQTIEVRFVLPGEPLQRKRIARVPVRIRNIKTFIYGGSPSGDMSVLKTVKAPKDFAGCFFYVVNLGRMVYNEDVGGLREHVVRNDSWYHWSQKVLMPLG